MLVSKTDFIATTNAAAPTNEIKLLKMLLRYALKPSCQFIEAEKGKRLQIKTAPRQAFVSAISKPFQIRI